MLLLQNIKLETFIRSQKVFLRIIIALTFGLWMLFVLFGKGGFVHILLLIAAGVTVAEVLHIYRSRLTGN